MYWNYETIQDEEGEKKFIQSILNDKYLTIGIFYESEVQAVLKASVIAIDEEEEEEEECEDIEYFSKTRVIGINRKHLDTKLRAIMEDEIERIKQKACLDGFVL